MDGVFLSDGFLGSGGVCESVPGIYFCGDWNGDG